MKPMSAKSRDTAGTRKLQHVARVVGMCMLVCAAVIVPLEATPPLPPDDALVEKLRSLSGEHFSITDTDHFTIAYDTPPAALRPLTGRLEGVRDAVWRFCEGNRLAAEPPRDRLGVILFAQHEDFLQYLSRQNIQGGSVAGIYLQQNEVAAFGHTLNTPSLAPVVRQIETLEARLTALRGRNATSKNPNRQRRDTLLQHLNTLRIQRDALVERFDRLVIQHEAAHQMLFHLGVHVRGATNPTWLVEGLATQFEVPQTRRSGQLTQVNHMRLADFRDALGVAPDAKTVTDAVLNSALTDGRLVPLREFIMDDRIFRTGGERIVFHYAQAWALVHYLQKERRHVFADYLRGLSSREPGVAISPDDEIRLFEDALGSVDETLQRTLVDYTLRLRFDRRRAGR